MGMTKSVHLKKSEMDTLQEILEYQKRNLVFKDSMEQDLNIGSDELSDEVDHANADVSKAHNLRFRNRENFYEKKIDEAIFRMSKNEYGVCKDCGTPIRFTRLKARPTAELCIICKEDSERDERTHISGRRSKSIGRYVNFATDFS